MLTERGVEFDVIEYLKTPLDRDTLASLVDLVPNDPADMVRKDKNFKELGLDAADYVTADAVVDLLKKYIQLDHPAKGQAKIGRTPFQHPCKNRND